MQGYVIKSKKEMSSDEEPEYKKVFLFPSDYPINAKIYVIDDDNHTTMLLAEEY